MGELGTGPRFGRRPAQCAGAGVQGCKRGGAPGRAEGPSRSCRKLAAAKRLTAESTAEQASAGLDALTDDERATFERLNDAYVEKHGFPFIIAVKDNTKASILAAFETRIDNDRETRICNRLPAGGAHRLSAAERTYSLPEGPVMTDRTYFVAPKGGHPPQSQLLTGRAVFTEAYAVLPAGTMQDIVTAACPFWDDTRRLDHRAPAFGICRGDFFAIDHGGRAGRRQRAAGTRREGASCAVRHGEGELTVSLDGGSEPF